jgi:hypothetical protein
MAPPKLYTEKEIKEAMIVGVGLGRPGESAVPAGTNTNIERAMEVFTGSHGNLIPSFERFRALLERREYRQAAEGHLAAAEMLEGSESMRHAALGQLAATIALAGEVSDGAHNLAQTIR